MNTDNESRLLVCMCHRHFAVWDGKFSRMNQLSEQGVDFFTLTHLNYFSFPGLRVEDLLNEDEPDIKEALALSAPEVRTGRTRRLKRAFDLGVKQKNYLDYAADVEQDTFKFEFYDLARQIRIRDHEFALLNQHKK